MMMVNVLLELSASIASRWANVNCMVGGSIGSSDSIRFGASDGIHTLQ